MPTSTLCTGSKSLQGPMWASAPTSGHFDTLETATQCCLFGCAPGGGALPANGETTPNNKASPYLGHGKFDLMASPDRVIKVAIY